MNKYIVGALGAAVLAFGAMNAQAAQVTLTGWAFGAGNKVELQAPGSSYNVYAGGFGGSLSGAFDLDTNHFVTYCIELEEQFSFSSAPMTHRLIEGGRYFHQRHGDAGIADSIGRLFTYAADHASLVSNAGGSTALQLAIWNLIYDTDNLVGNAAGSFYTSSPYAALATELLLGAESAVNRFDVFALERAGGQDFLAVRERAVPRLDVPEPGSLALAGAALAGLAFARRRRVR